MVVFLYSKNKVVFCFLSVFFFAKKKKKSILQKRAEMREKIGSFLCRRKRRQKPTHPKFLIALQKKRTTHTHFCARTHHNHLKIERFTRNNKHHGRTRRRSIRKRTHGTSSILFFSS